MKKRKAQPASTTACAIDGCALPGEFKAPKSREELHSYRWLCLDHVREFNKSWNYFDGMDAEAIEDFMHDAVTGHRPTWQREDHIRRQYQKYSDLLRDEFTRFFHWGSVPTRDGKPITARERRALAVLNLDGPCTLSELKRHYRNLVKTVHPDLHRGDKNREEEFKRITEAYATLLKLYQNP